MNFSRLKGLAAGFLASSLLLTSCSTGGSSAPTSATPLVLKVSTLAAERGNLDRITAFTGRVMPDGAVFVIPKLQGEVTAVHFEVGDSVKKGDVLFELDDAIDQLQLKQAQAALDTALAGLKQATGATFESQLLQLEGQVKQAQSQKKWTENTYDIYDDSYSGNAKLMTEQKKLAEAAVKRAKAAYEALPAGDPNKQTAYEAYLTAKSALQSAENALNGFVGGYETQYNSLTQGLEQVTIGLDIAEKAYGLATGPAHEEQINMIKSQLGQAQVGYDMALQKLTYSKVSSPISGVIQQKNVALHGFATQSAPSYVISDEGALAVTFGVSAAIASNLSVGDNVTLESGSKTYQAPIVEIAGMIDQASGLFTVKAQLEESAPELMSGVAVKLTAVTDKAENALLVPAGAVYYDNGKPYLYVVRDGVAAKAFVTTGIVTDEKAEITSGIDSSTQVITSWSPQLIDGIPVELKQEV